MPDINNDLKEYKSLLADMPENIRQMVERENLTNIPFMSVKAVVTELSKFAKVPTPNIDVGERKDIDNLSFADYNKLTLLDIVHEMTHYFLLIKDISKTGKHDKYFKEVFNSFAEAMNYLIEMRKIKNITYKIPLGASVQKDLSRPKKIRALSTADVALASYNNLLAQVAEKYGVKAPRLIIVTKRKRGDRQAIVKRSGETFYIDYKNANLLNLIDLMADYLSVNRPESLRDIGIEKEIHDVRRLDQFRKRFYTVKEVREIDRGKDAIAEILINDFMEILGLN